MLRRESMTQTELNDALRWASRQGYVEVVKELKKYM